MSADYKVPLTPITDDRGEVFKLVEHYTDGIIMGDPVKLVIYDAAGNLVDETPFWRDVLTYRNSGGDLYLFQTGSEKVVTLPPSPNKRPSTMRRSVV